MTRAAPSIGPASAEPGGDEVGPAGWHLDPWQRHGLRFHDGRLWTEHVADGGVASIDSTPVAGMERSRPLLEQAAPPDDPVGARVLPGVVEGADVLLAAAPLLLVGPAGSDRSQWLRTPADGDVGLVAAAPPRFAARLGRALVAEPSRRLTRLVVRDGTGAEALRLSRPLRRTAAVVDVVSPDGPLGKVVADRVVQELRARVVTAGGRELGTLVEAGAATASLSVLGGDGTLQARLTPVWDVPGRRRHLPPGVLLLDRRPPSGAAWDDAAAALLLAALLSPALLCGPAREGRWERSIRPSPPSGRSWPGH